MNSSYNIQYQYENVPVNSTLPRKKFFKHALQLLLPFILAGWCLHYKTPALASQHIWTPFFTLPLFNLKNILMEPCAMFIRDDCHVFRKKLKWEWRK
jgi:hypothetical protein